MPLSNLNAEQYAAATANLGHNLVIASAGTGKTSTIVGRIAFLLQSIEPKDILLLTFTNKAAQEMMARVDAIFGNKISSSIESGTFHAVALRYLKQHSTLHLKQPKELKTLFKSLYDKRVFINRTNTPPYSANYLYDLYGLYLNACIQRPFSAWISEKMPAQESYTAIYEDMISEFNDLKKLHHYADYSDLLYLYKQEMLKLDSPLYKEVLCDEYQDTNPLQDSILDSLKSPSLFCVGDYDQSIYAFNGADISIISSFAIKYSNAKVFTLSKNYRSSQAILNLANKVIQKNQRIYPKSLEVVKQGDFKPPSLIVFDELFLQYQGIAKRIQLSNMPFEDIAIIFRNNSSADGLEASLRELKIPCKRKGSTSFFDTKEIKLLLDICSIIYNPKDMMACIHTLSHGKGIGNAIAKDIYEALYKLGESNCINGLLKPNDEIRPYEQRAKNTQLGLFDDFFILESKARFDEFIDKNFASHPIFLHPKINKEGAIFLSEFYVLIKHLLIVKNNPKALISTILSNDFFNNTIMNFAQSRAKDKDGNINAEKYESALDSIKLKGRLLLDLSKNYNDLGKFLNAMILGSNEASEGKGVNLLSVHASKGLEFKCVYIVDLMDGRFPNRKLISKGGSLEEERRLFYVATTRAKDNLILSFAKKDAIKNIDYEPSIFLYEAELLSKDSEF